MTVPDPLLSIAEARRVVADAVRPLGPESVAVALALGRTLAEDVSAADDVPPFANSAMDGFAVEPGPAGRRLKIVGESRAGAPAAAGPGHGQALRISTGAVVPAGAWSVVPVERADEQDGWVTVAVDAPSGLNVRAAGEDMRAGEAVLERGAVLGPAELGVAVSAGRGELTCAQRPRVSVLTSGDELREPGTALGPGEIPDSNAVTLRALVTAAGAALQPGARVADTARDTEAAIGGALERSDLLVISGGVSVGAHDHVKGALRALGVEQRFWRVALRPGKPTWFGVRGSALVFGLPGNPVSAMVTFLLFVRPALSALQGARSPVVRRSAILGETLPRNAERDEAVRVRLEQAPEGLVAFPTGPQGSHQLTSMLGADALLLVEAGSGSVEAGAWVQVELI